jgi:uncharacterized protein (TIRG00374 family)
MSPDPAIGSGMIKRILPWLRAIITIALLYAVYHREDPRQVLAIFSDIRPGPLLLLFVMYFINTMISAWKWKLFLQADAIHVSLPRLIRSYLVGSFLNLFLPSSIGGDAYRVYDVARQSRRTAHSFASVLADRISGFIALVVLGLSAGVIGFKQIPDHQIIWIPLVAMVTLSLGTVLIFQQTIILKLLNLPLLNRLHAIHRLTSKVFSSVNQYRAAPFLFARVMALSFMFQINAIFCIYMLSRGLGLDIDLLYFCIFVPIISLIEALPISIFGLGIRDASYVFFFGSVGVDPLAAKSMALAYVLVTVVYSATGGLILLARSVRTDPPPST